MSAPIDSLSFDDKEHDRAVAPGPSRRRMPVFTFAFLVATVWTLAFVISAVYNIISADQRTIEAAKLQARTAFETDLLYQNWLGEQRGLYAHPSETVLPNPYLPEDVRTIPLPGSQVLVRITPDYLSRLVHEKARHLNGILSHLTSSTPIRLQNRPDPWEADSLRLLETGLVKEVTEIQTINGRKYLRFMSGLPTQESCLSCHISTTLQPLNIAGGISVSVPMDMFIEGVKNHKWTLSITHLALWFLGILGIFFATRTLIAYLRDRDQTERDLFITTETVKRREQELAAFVNNVDAGVFLKDPDGRFILVNKRLCEIFELPREAILGKSNEELADEGIGQELDTQEREVLKTAKAVEVKNALSFNNQDTIYSSFLFPVLDKDSGKAISVGALIVDMTEREHTEQAIRQARDDAEKASAAKSNFLANTSHEIRTPLNGLIGMSDLLLRTRLNADQASMVSAIKSSGDALLAVINDILDISKITAGKMTLESIPFDLRDALYGAVKSLTPVAYEKGLELILHVSPQVPDRVVGDPLRLRQVILNLVSNALKFTSKGEILLSVQSVDVAESLPDNVRIRFSVTDTGIGIPSDAQEKIFHAFEQVDSSTTRKYGGTGLGLAICTQLLGIMGSKMELESSEGFGSTFWFVLDMAVGPQAQSLQPHTPSEPLGGVEVLIIDDNETNLIVLSEMLSQWGMNVTRATSVFEALALARTRQRSEAAKPFDIVLTDFQMRDLGGRDFLQCLKNTPDLADIPVILLSSGLSVECPDADNTAFAAILDKPVHPFRLRSAILCALHIESAECASSDIVGRMAPPGASKSLRVLLVEDVKMNQIVASRMLTELGHECIIANDGKEALRLLRDEEPFDVILMDIQMPVMDGVQATRLIRKMEEDGLSDRNLIIAMTANALKEDIAAYLDAGMDTSLTKPVLMEDLKRILDQSVFRLPANNAARPSPPDTEDKSESGSLIDWLILKRNFATKTDILIDSMRLYLRDAPHLLAEIGDAIERTDSDALSAQAHALKGMTGYFNRGSVLDACLRLEKWGRDRRLPGNRVALEKDYRDLAELIDRLVEEMKTYVNGVDAGQKPNGE